MRIQRIDLSLKSLVLLAVLASCGSAWAASSNCSYSASSAAIDGAGTGGTGMGGTGIVAKGTGIGGTGIRPEVEMSEMQLAGKVVYSQGTVEAQSYGRSRLLAKGDPVCVGETIVTAQTGKLQIRMADDGMVAVRPQTQLTIEKFVYSGTNKDTSMFALLNGATRFVTGKIGKLYPQNDLIVTQTATIGVRGTDHEATVILPGDSRGYPSGTYDKVNQGVTFIKTDKGEIDIHPNQAGLAVNIGEMPTLLKDIPDFYSADPSIRDEGSLSAEGSKEEGMDDHNKEGQSPDRSGKGIELPHPSETGATSSELPDNPIDINAPETPELPELPESLELPELPELPERPDY